MGAGPGLQGQGVGVGRRCRVRGCRGSFATCPSLRSLTRCFSCNFFASPRPQLSPPPAAAQRCSLGPSPHVPMSLVPMSSCLSVPCVPVSQCPHTPMPTHPCVSLSPCPMSLYLHAHLPVSVTSSLCPILCPPTSPVCNLCVTSSPFLMAPCFDVPVCLCSHVPMSPYPVSLCMVPHDPCPVPSSPQAVQPSWSSQCWPLCA